MAVVRQWELDRDMKPYRDKAQFALERLIDAANHSSTVFLSQKIVQEFSKYLKIYLEECEAQVEAELRDRPYKPSDKPSNRRKNHGTEGK